MAKAYASREVWRSCRKRGRLNRRNYWQLERPTDPTGQTEQKGVVFCFFEQDNCALFTPSLASGSASQMRQNWLVSREIRSKPKGLTI